MVAGALAAGDQELPCEEVEEAGLEFERKRATSSSNPPDRGTSGRTEKRVTPSGGWVLPSGGWKVQ